MPKTVAQGPRNGTCGRCVRRHMEAQPQPHGVKGRASARGTRLECFLLAEAFCAELAPLVDGEPAGGDEDGRDEGEGHGVRRGRGGDAGVFEREW